VADPSLPAWYRLEVYGAEEDILAFTNPIFAGPQRTITLKKFEDLFLQYQIERHEDSSQ
jgi:hypothetical protein